MAYNPGTLHVKRLMPTGAPAPVDSTVEIVPSSELIKDPTDGTVVLSGIVLEDLVAGAASINLPPTTGMDPDPVTYAVRVHIKGYEPEEWVTGVEITAGDVTELAEQTSVVPGESVPNVQKQLEAIRDQAVADMEAVVGEAAASAEVAGEAAAAAGGSSAAAAESAAAALVSKDAAAQSALDADADRQAAQAAAATATTIIRTGTGSPLGVVSAPVGTEYRDLAGTNGAWVWRKQSGGAGNTGWVCVEGDTLWRNLAQYLNATLMTAGTLYWRRVNNRTTLSLNSATFSAASGQIASGLPAAVDLWSTRMPAGPIYRGSISAGVLYAGGSGGILNISAQVAGGHVSVIENTVDAAWPSTLPGA